MRIPLFGTGVASGQKQVTVRKTVGMYWERRGETEKAPMVAVPFPGWVEVSAMPISSPIRGLAADWDQVERRLIVVCGTKVYLVKVAVNPVVATEIGTMESTLGPVQIAPGPDDDFLITDGVNSYFWDGTTFTKLDEAFASCTWIGGYWVAARSGWNTGIFYISADGTTWTDLATAEASPDGLRNVIATRNELFLLGHSSIEVWSHTGDADFPFARVNGATSSLGSAGARSAALVGGVLHFVAQSESGRPFVARMNGYTPERVSTDDVDRLLGALYSINPIVDAVGFVWNGHPMLVLTQPSVPWSIYFDTQTGLWGFVTDGTASALAMCVEFGSEVYAAKREPITGSMLYRLDEDAHSLPARRIITDHVVSPDGERFTVDSLRLDMATNMDAAEKSVSLKVSRDGGLSWGATQSVGLGTTSGPQKKAEFRRLGRARSFTFDLTFPTDVPLTVHSASLNASD